MVLVFAFSTTAFAATTAEVSNDIKVKSVELNLPQPRYPSGAYIYSAEAYAADSTQGIYYTDAFTYMDKFTGQFSNMSLNAATAKIYQEQNCDSLYVTVAIDNGKADRYEFYVNNTLVGKGNFGPYYEGFVNTFTFLAPVVESTNEASWKVILYDNEDASIHGLPLYGYISID